MPELGQPLIAWSLAILVLGSAWIAGRELRAHPASRRWVLGLALLWMVALALRLWLSPHTFLHEYYTLVAAPQSLAGVSSPHGNTAPGLFNLAAVLLGRESDPEVIFLTNAIVSSLAIPAIALLDLSLFGSWPRALCAGLLLCLLPQHLRFSAAEDAFVQAVTFGMWTLVVFALYLRTRRLEDGVVCALALSLAMQTRPEMLFFPAALLGFVALVRPQSWRVLFEWRTLAALAVLVGLLVLPLLDVYRFLETRPPPSAHLPALRHYMDSLVLMNADLTPAAYRWLLIVGLVWGMLRTPGPMLWVLTLFVGYSLFSRSLFDNPPYNLRSQILPTSFLVLIAAGAVPAWMAAWRHRARTGAALGSALIALLAVSQLISWRGFVTELRDQQLEWSFLNESIPQLPHRGTLLWAGPGPTEQDDFAQLLLRHAGKRYDVVDVRRVLSGDQPWPPPTPDLVYYQGMHCHFAAHGATPPERTAAFCDQVSARYALEPLVIEDIAAGAYSSMRYGGDGRGPFRIGFYRATRANGDRRADGAP